MGARKEKSFDVPHALPAVATRRAPRRRVQKCTLLLAVIGPRWLAATADSTRRLDDPNDLRIEIGSALRRQIPVVPLLVDGARMPRADDLPDDFKPLARRNGTEIRHDPDFHNDMTRLLSRLGEAARSTGCAG